MKYVLVFLIIFITSVPVVGKMYIGDITLSSKKMDDLMIVGEANLDTITANSISVLGNLGASNAIADNLSVTGPARVSNSSFKKTSITGPVFLIDGLSDTISITGFADLKNVTIAKHLKIIGMLKAVKSKFNRVTLSMTDSSFIDPTATSITIKAPSNGELQHLMLYGNTHIDSIKFESGQGESHMHGNDIQVLNVSGGKIVRKKQL
jgi:hypothetical protein